MNQLGKMGIEKHQSSIDFKRYQRLLWKKKLFILTVTGVVSVIWFVLYSLFLSGISYESSAVLKFDDPRLNRDVGAVTDFAIMSAHGKIAVLKTQSFLGRVVDSLKYNIIFDDEKINPTRLYKKISITKNAVYGQYTVDFENDTLNVSFVGSDDLLDNILLSKDHFRKSEDPFFRANGLYIVFDSDELYKFSPIEFSLIPKENAIDALGSMITPILDRSQTVLTVSISDKNPEFSAIIVNTLVNLFSKQLLEHKRLQASSVLGSLEQQLQVAMKELDDAEILYRTFRENNPLVTLSENRQTTVSNLATLQTNKKDRKQILETLRKLMELDPTGKTFEDQSNQYQQKIGFLETQNVPGANIAITEYTLLNSEREQLLSNNFPAQHPEVLRVERQLSELAKDIDEAIVQHENDLERSIRNLSYDINREYRGLQDLPGNELELAELERNRQIKDVVVSSIMAKIEEAKVSDAAVIPDAYVIDEALPALKPAKPIQQLALPFIGPILGILIGVGVVILMDLLDNTVKSVKDLESNTNLKVLASIPIIIDEKNIPEHIKSSGELDPKLITSDFAPVLASEQFRFIRTKLSFDSHDDSRCIIVTSIAPGDGKSLISSNLAVTFAQQKVPTLLIDCDLRRGVLHKSFNCVKKPGISDLLISGKNVNESLISDAAQETHVPHLYLIASGLQIPNPSELLGSNRMKDLLDTFKESFQAIVLDTPPIEFIPDALALNTFVHNILLVAREGKTSINDIKNKLNEYSKIGSDFKYVILNASREVDAHAYNSYSYYNY
jgi:capsular exopolysaccharide synthesis family protein